MGVGPWRATATCYIRERFRDGGIGGQCQLTSQPLYVFIGCIMRWIAFGLHTAYGGVLLQQS